MKPINAWKPAVITTTMAKDLTEEKILKLILWSVDYLSVACIIAELSVWYTPF
jgi:hypothetical protein